MVYVDLITDAAGWPDTIQVQQVYDYTSDDGNTTVTGTATFTFTRASLGDKIASAKLCFGGGALPDQGEYLPVQYALGRMPGWVVQFGAQDTQANAFTVTTVDPTGMNQPVVSHRDADCTVESMVCALVAPGRSIYPLAADTYGEFPDGFLGENGGFAPATNDDGDDVSYVAATPYTVELIQPGSAATQTAPAVLPVYRVTIPSDVGSVLDYDLTINLNGNAVGFSSPTGSGTTFIPGLMASFLSMVGNPYPRSAYVGDVQLYNVGDVLAAGTIAYRKYQQAESYAIVITGQPGTLYYNNNVRVTITNPFNLPGQTIEQDDDDDDDNRDTGPQVTIQF